MLVPFVFNVETTVGAAEYPTMPDGAELGPVPYALLATTLKL